MAENLRRFQDEVNALASGSRDTCHQASHRRA